jgi:hypothetical protein
MWPVRCPRSARLVLEIWSKGPVLDKFLGRADLLVRDYAYHGKYGQGAEQYCDLQPRRKPRKQVGGNPVDRVEGTVILRARYDSSLQSL